MHRDLKPANVFSDNGVVKIGDVGLSKYISESRRSAQTQSVGTVYYMAPEVARGRYGREVDIYAIGIMLVEMMTGRVPFDGETTAEILMKHLTAEPDLSAIPADVRPVIAAALEKDPGKRIADIDELERRFRAAVGAVTGQPAAIPQQKPSPLDARPAAAAAGAAAGGGAPRPDRIRASLERGREARERSIAGVRGSWQPLTDFWNERVPTPIKWILGGTAFILILELGAFRSVAAGALVGGIAYVVWQAWTGCSVHHRLTFLRTQISAAKSATESATAGSGCWSRRTCSSSSSGARSGSGSQTGTDCCSGDLFAGTMRQIPRGQRTLI